MMESNYQYELLANYLRPRFGNIYEYNLNGGLAFHDYQEWTDDLKDAVRHYLLYELPADVEHWLLATRDANESKQEKVEWLLELQPCDVALIVRRAVVVAVPSLEELIARVEVWPSEDDRSDALYWLEAHLSGEQSSELAFVAAQRHDKTAVKDLIDVVETLSPAELLDSWAYVAGPAPTDLTNDEWALIAPFVPHSPRVSDESVVREAINGMLWRYAHPGRTSPRPIRYGHGPAIDIRKFRYKKSGVFDQMLAALASNPNATRLVEWLRSMKKDGRRSRRPNIAEETAV
jgi:hypothetical protein